MRYQDIHNQIIVESIHNISIYNFRSFILRINLYMFIFGINLYSQNLGGVWFGCFLFSFSLKTENDDENVFGLISENIFSENENRKQLENENNKFSFSVDYRNLILVKMKLWWQWM